MAPVWTLPVLLLWAATPLQLAPAGTTRWLEAEVRDAGGWSLPVAPSGPWLLVELEGHGPFADLDLTVEGPDWVRRSASHLDRERLLLPIGVGAPGGALSVRVTAAEGASPYAPARFRLGLTVLAPRAGGVPGGAIPGALEADRRALLFSLRPPKRAPLRLALERLDGPGVVDLLVFDRLGEPLAICEAAAVGEAWRLQPPIAPEDAAPEDDPWWVVVLARADRARFELAVVVDEARAPAARDLDAFVQRLARTSAQRRALAALRQHPDYLRIHAYLERYPGGPPLRLRVVPGLLAHGVERFGTYSQGVLTINPTIAGHRDNVQELVDTLIHELIHAVLALPRADGFPLAPDVSDSGHDPMLAGHSGQPLRRGRVAEPLASYLESAYGPSASNPDEDFTDINAGAQRLVMKVVTENLRRTGLGEPTLVFQNARLRAQAAK